MRLRVVPAQGATTVAPMSSTTPITRRIAASVASLFALAATVVVAPAASAAPSDASFVAPNAGYNGVYGGTDAAQSFIFDVEGTDVKAFCVEFNKELNRDAAFTTASLTSGLGEAAWIAANHTSVGTPLSDVNAENAAAAIAIWHYTDSIDITTPVPEELGIRDRVDEVVAAAAGKSVTPGPSGFDLDLEASFDSGTDEATATATFTTTSGTPVAGAAV